MQVTVIIPAYRAAETICRAVDSVLAQTHPAHEIIVIDDGSPDVVSDVVQQAYGERVILVRQANGGASAARNAGIERATGEFVAFLDADDYWEPHKLELQLAVFKRHPEVGFVATAWFSQEPGRSLRTVTSLAQPSFDNVLTAKGADAFDLAMRIWTGTVMIRKGVIGSERFRTDLQTAEDRDFWIRIISRTSTHVISVPLATAVLEPGSLSRAIVDRNFTNMLRVVESHRKLLGPLGARAWQSRIYYYWAACENDPASALPLLAKSFWLWPFPYGKASIGPLFGRLKRTAFVMGRAMRVW